MLIPYIYKRNRHRQTRYIMKLVLPINFLKKY
jgi:hypothetical protein